MTPRQLGRFSWVSRFTGPGAATLAQSLRAVRMGGRISIIGVLSGVQTTIDITAILMSAVRLQGILVGHRESFEVRCQIVKRIMLTLGQCATKCAFSIQVHVHQLVVYRRL